MNVYLILKTIHILCATILVSTGFGISLVLFLAGRSGQYRDVAVTLRFAARAGWWLTTPALPLQLLSGVGLLRLLHYPWTTPWALAVLVLFGFSLACWIPAAFILRQLHQVAAGQLATGMPDPRFASLMRLWNCLGLPALIGVMVIFWIMLMVPPVPF